MKLNDLKCKNLKPKDKAYKATDGDGLYLEVMPNGSKYWRMNYRFNGKQKRLAFGVYPEVNLKEAREQREKARKIIREEKDPSEEKKIRRQERKFAYENNFEALTRKWHEQTCFNISML